MRLFPRVLAVTLLLAAMSLMIRHAKELSDAGESEVTHLVTYYFCILGLAAVTALVSYVLLLPLFGEYAGNFIFNPNEKIERNLHAEALVKLAAGDFQGAVDEYRAVFEEDPQDIHAASEIVRLYCEKLNEPDSAADFLVEALSYAERLPEDVAFFSQRLVDVCWHYQHDGIRARAILIKIAKDMPETREAANALHRVQEIDRIMNHDVDLGTESASADSVGASTETTALPVVKPSEA